MRPMIGPAISPMIRKHPRVANPGNGQTTIPLRMAGWPLRRAMGVAALAGAVAALGQAPFDLWPLALLGFALIYGLFLGADGVKRAFWLGWAGGAGYFTVALHWIIEPFLVDIARHGWMAPFALLLMAGGLALFWGVAAALARRLDRRFGSGAMLFVALFTLAELARSYVLTGFPWSLIGYLWAPSPMVHWAALIGPHGLTALVMVTAVAIWHWRRAAPVLLVMALMLGGGWWMGRPVAETGPRPIVRLIQPNAPQHQKWDPAHMTRFYQRQLALSAAPHDPEKGAPVLTIWPETAIPWVLGNANTALKSIAKSAGGPVVLGMRRLEGKRLMNSAVLIDRTGWVKAVYDKFHLVPFGEYMPLGDLFARFGISGMANSEGNGFYPGPGQRLMTLPGLGRALPLICYEAVFAHDVGAAPARPDFLMQLTNDAWFGGFSGPYQHLQQARMRAIEQGLPMIRVANTGISAMIGPKGRLLDHLVLNQAGFIDAALPAPLVPTVYGRFGDMPATALALGLLWVGFLRRRRDATPQS